MKQRICYDTPVEFRIYLSPESRKEERERETNENRRLKRVQRKRKPSPDPDIRLRVVKIRCISSHRDQALCNSIHIYSHIHISTYKMFHC